MWKDKNNQKEFKYMHCVDILQVLPKFDPMIEEDIDLSMAVDLTAEEDAEGDKKPAAVNGFGAPMGAAFKRPIGSKAAKAGRKDEYSVASMESSKIDAIREMTSTHKLLTQEIKMNTHYQKQRHKADTYRNNSDKFYKMYQIAKDFDDKEQMKYWRDKINSLQVVEEDEPAPPPVAEVPDFIDTSLLNDSHEEPAVQEEIVVETVDEEDSVEEEAV